MGFVKEMMNQNGFTLIELGIVIAILAILSVGAYVAYTGFSDQAKVDTTTQEMLTIKRAIVGSAEVASGGKYSAQGYMGDVGNVPPTLQDLVANNAAAPAWNPYTHRGWNGPYIDPSVNNLNDAWGNPYQYLPNTQCNGAAGTNKNFYLRSYGADGVAGGTGVNADIVVCN